MTRAVVADADPILQESEGGDMTIGTDATERSFANDDVGDVENETDGKCARVRDRGHGERHEREVFEKVPVPDPERVVDHRRRALSASALHKV